MMRATPRLPCLWERGDGWFGALGSPVLSFMRKRGFEPTCFTGPHARSRSWPRSDPSCYSQSLLHTRQVVLVLYARLDQGQRTYVRSVPTITCTCRYSHPTSSHLPEAWFVGPQSIAKPHISVILRAGASATPTPPLHQLRESRETGLLAYRHTDPL